MELIRRRVALPAWILQYPPPHMTCIYPLPHVTRGCGSGSHTNTPPRHHTTWREKRICDLTSSSSASHDARSSIHFTTRGPCPSALIRGAWPSAPQALEFAGEFVDVVDEGGLTCGTWPSALESPMESRQWASSIKSRFLVARSLFSRSTWTRRCLLPSSPAARTTALPSSHSLSASTLSSWARESPAPGACRGRCT